MLLKTRRIKIKIQDYNPQVVSDWAGLSSTPKWVLGVRAEVSLANHPVKIMYLVNAVTDEAKIMLDMWCTGIGGLLRDYDKRTMYMILSPYGLPLDGEAVSIAYQILQDTSISLDHPIMIDMLTGDILTRRSFSDIKES